MELEKKKQSKERICEECKSIEGKPRKVGNYIVELSELTLDNKSKLLCQGCKNKTRNLRSYTRITEKSNNGIRSFKILKTKKR